MQTTVQAATQNAGVSGSSAGSSGLHLEIQPGAGESEHFRAMFEQYLQKDALKIKPNSNSLGSMLANRTTNLASQVKQDQQYVSKMLEQATRTGDSMQLMKAMMALNDYQLRVQTISKTVSKASSSIDSLTKLQ